MAKKDEEISEGGRMYIRLSNNEHISDKDLREMSNGHYSLEECLLKFMTAEEIKKLSSGEIESATWQIPKLMKNRLKDRRREEAALNEYKAKMFDQMVANVAKGKPTIIPR